MLKFRSDDVLPEIDQLHCKKMQKLFDSLVPGEFSFANLANWLSYIFTSCAAGLDGNVGHINNVHQCWALLVTVSIRVNKHTYVTSHSGELSLAISPWVGAMNTSKSWDVSRQTAQCISPMSMVCQHMSG